MGDNSYQLPNETDLDAIGEHDRAMVLDVHLRKFDETIVRLEAGDATPMKGTVEDALDETRDGRKELILLAQKYGLWLDEVAA